MTQFKQDPAHCSVRRVYKRGKDARKEAVAVSQAEMKWLGQVCGRDVASTSILSLLRNQNQRIGRQVGCGECEKEKSRMTLRLLA